MKILRRQKCISLVLGSLITLSTLSGCGNNQESTLSQNQDTPATVLDASKTDIVNPAIDPFATFVSFQATITVNTKKHNGELVGNERTSSEWRYDIRSEITTTVDNCFFYGAFNHFYILDGFITKDMYNTDMTKEENFDYDLYFRTHSKLWVAQSTLVVEQGNIFDTHPLYHLRINTTCQQFDEFYETYDIKEGDLMYLAPEDRIKIW